MVYGGRKSARMTPPAHRTPGAAGRRVPPAGFAAILARVSTPLDLVAIGRVSVDLYGQQLGSRLEDIATFAKGVGGCPANVAIGAARLGLKAALITRVGDEPMGRFVREQLEREGVDTRGVQVDRERLTPLVLLSVRRRWTDGRQPPAARNARSNDRWLFCASAAKGLGIARRPAPRHP